MGRFKLGSTVINLFAKNQIRFDSSMEEGEVTVLGTPYAHQLKADTLHSDKTKTSAQLSEQ